MIYKENNMPSLMKEMRLKVTRLERDRVKSLFDRASHGRIEKVLVTLDPVEALVLRSYFGIDGVKKSVVLMAKEMNRSRTAIYYHLNKGVGKVLRRENQACLEKGAKK
jgi:DNA-directed RNA polymerase sigma subunit (sigma70/sigma32)